MTDRLSHRVAFWVDRSLLDQVDAECERDEVSRGEWLREACRAYLVLSERDDALTDAEWRRIVGDP